MPTQGEWVEAHGALYYVTFNDETQEDEEPLLDEPLTLDDDIPF